MAQKEWTCSSCGKKWELAFLKEDLDPSEAAEFEFEQIASKTWAIYWCPECSPGVPKGGWFKRAKDAKKDTAPFLWKGDNPEKLLGEVDESDDDDDDDDDF